MEAHSGIPVWGTACSLSGTSGEVPWGKVRPEKATLQKAFGTIVESSFSLS